MLEEYTRREGSREAFICGRNRDYLVERGGRRYSVVIGTDVVICPHDDHILVPLLHGGLRRRGLHIGSAQQLQQRVSLHGLQPVGERGERVQWKVLQQATR